MRNSFSAANMSFGCPNGSADFLEKNTKDAHVSYAKTPAEESHSVCNAKVNGIFL